MVKDNDKKNSIIPKNSEHSDILDPCHQDEIWHDPWTHFPYHGVSTGSNTGSYIPDSPIFSPSSKIVPVKETVNHPAHYGGGDNVYEAIKIIEHYMLGFCLGNTIKYILRAGRKSKETELEDLKKAAWYLNRQIENLENENKCNSST